MATWERRRYAFTLSDGRRVLVDIEYRPPPYGPAGWYGVLGVATTGPYATEDAALENAKADAAVCYPVRNPVVAVERLDTAPAAEG